LRALGRSVLAGSHYALAPDKPCSNASLRFDRDGRIAGRHDKPHLVDIGLVNQPNYREFETAGGNRVATADIGGAVASLSVHHIRFPKF
jgi:predicted amidohydrolase